MSMNDDGTLTGTRPDWAWTIAHTDTRDNHALWSDAERPIPIGYSMPMTWHHVLGWDILKKTWSSLAYSARKNYTDAQAAATDSQRTPFFMESARLYEILKAWLQTLDLTSRYNDGDTTFSDNKVDDIIEAFERTAWTTTAASRWRGGCAGPSGTSSRGRIRPIARTILPSQDIARTSTNSTAT